ncbi:hypothetical protein [Nonlabens sp. Asnod3-A02]|uniref:hypothetical protein n=1 Tax=Nonlabens sp. Asnod3-A02 TaxID=3160579 RepID=UPI00386E248E
MIKRHLLLAFLIILTSCKTIEKEKEDSIEDNTENILSIEGKASNPEGINGEINIMGYFVEPIIGGEIANNGTFKIELPQDFDAITRNSFNTYNSSPDAEYNLEFTSALDSFPNASELDFTGKKELIAYAGKFFRFEIISPEKTHYIFSSSSKNFVDYAVGKSDATPEKGYHYYYIYAKGPISIIGEQVSENLFEDDSNEIYSRIDSYQLDIQEGWNLIKYEVLSLKNSSTGKAAITETEVSTEDLTSTKMTWLVE